jgi:hypothetical protein
MAGQVAPHPPQYHESTIMNGPQFLNHLSTASPANDYASSIDNAYTTSGPPSWSVPPTAMNYGQMLFEEQMSFPPSPAPDPTQTSLVHFQAGYRECEFPFEEPPTAAGAGPAFDATRRQSSAGSSDDVVSMNQNPTNVQSNEFTPPHPSQAPRLRSVNAKRRAKSKYGSPDGGEDDLSDTSPKPRPAHNKAERNYRRRLNSSFEKLLDVMNLVAPEDVTSRHDAESSRELSKGDVLRLARHRLVALETENRRLREELRHTRIRPQRAFSWSGVAPTH